MSRCFPFPPPGYAKSISGSEALIESIKLPYESKKAKKDRKKEKRREKKDKRKDREGKEGTTSHAGDGKEFKHIELEKNSGCVQRGDYHESEQLERSDVTEEHDRAISKPQPCYSDSTQRSNKRKRNTSPSSYNHGAVIKIRLSLRKHTEPEESKLEDQLVSTSRTVDSFTQDTHGADHPLPCVTNAETERDQCPGNYDSRHCEAAPTTNLLNVERMGMVSMYNSLFQNWLPSPPTYDGFKSEDQDWLFSSELQEERPVSKKVKSVTGALRCSSASLWPRAQYLPEVESYALPYAVPF